MRVHGYAVHPGREGDGGAVRIEGFECDLEDVRDDRRAALREAFLAVAKTADAIEETERRLYAWWH